MTLKMLKARLDEALDRPLTQPGSAALARRFIARFDDHADWLELLAKKAQQTLADGERHSLAVVSPDAPVVAIHAQTWYGTHRECQSDRVGEYLATLLAVGQRLAGPMGVPLAALLQVDAYVREGVDGHVDVDIEYSIVPGKFVGADKAHEGDWPSMLLLNPDLCTVEERQALAQASRAR
jgi:hypothetical protein